MNFLGRILGDNQGLSEFGNFFDQMWNERAAHNQTLLQDQMLRNLNSAGLAASPSGQDILSQALAENSAQNNAAYGQQVASLSVPLVQLVQDLQERGRQRQFQEAQAALDRAHQLSYLENQMVTHPLDYQQGMIPINSQAFRQATNDYRSMYPDWNRDPNAALYAAMNQQRGGGGAGTSGTDMQSFRDEAAGFFGWDKPVDRSWVDQWNANNGPAPGVDLGMGSRASVLGAEFGMGPGSDYSR